MQGNKILRSEIENALKQMKNDKTCGEMGIEKVGQLANDTYKWDNSSMN